MKLILNLLAIYCTIFLALFVVGAGVGFLLHWAVPAVNIGTGILIGVVTAAFAGQAFAATMEAIKTVEPADETDDEPEGVIDLEKLSTLVYVPPPRRRRKRR